MPPFEGTLELLPWIERIEVENEDDACAPVQQRVEAATEIPTDPMVVARVG